MKRALALSLALGALAAGCDRCAVEPITSIPDAVDQVDVFDQKQAAEVDVLWMIDNSPSMEAEQKKIAERFNDFFNELLVSAVDYHIGVISSDAAEGGVLRAYTGPPVGGCNGCRFVTKDTPCDNPSVDISGLSSEQEIDDKLATECPAQLVFRNLAQTGSDGPPNEKGFLQAAQALGVADVDPATGMPLNDVPTENAGFLRPEAALYIVFVSDEDEGEKENGAPVRYYQRLFESLKGAGNENKVAVAAITGFPDADPPAPLADVCSILQTTFDANNANDDPRANALVEALRNYPDGCNDEQAGPNDSNSFAETGGRYIELACRTGGVIADMCKADYSTALDALGANAAGLLRKFTLSLNQADIEWGSDCIPDTADDIALDCDEDGKKDGPLDGPICVKALGIQGACESTDSAHLVPRDDNCGWTLEVATNSIRFNGGFIPEPGTQVEVRYLKKPANRRCGG